MARHFTLLSCKTEIHFVMVTDSNHNGLISSGWSKIEPARMVLNSHPGRSSYGFDETCKIVLVADSLLGGERNIFGLDGTFECSAGTITNGNECFDSRLFTFRDDLCDLICGKTTEAYFDFSGFPLRIFIDQGLRDIVCVEGSCNVPLEFFGLKRKWPKQVGRGLRDNDLRWYCQTRFAFVTSIIDPPLLENFIEDINNFERYLSSI